MGEGVHVGGTDDRSADVVIEGNTLGPDRYVSNVTDYGAQSCPAAVADSDTVVGGNGLTDRASPWAERPVAARESASRGDAERPAPLPGSGPLRSLGSGRRRPGLRWAQLWPPASFSRSAARASSEARAPLSSSDSEEYEPPLD